MSRRLIVVAVLAAFFAVLMTSGVAEAAYTTNQDCLTCHGSGGSAVNIVDFGGSVGSVDRTVVCQKCHWEGVGSHPFHNSSWNCGACHSGMGTTNPNAIPKVYTANGFFNSASSALADSGTLHIIHSNPTWAGKLTKKNRQCQSCHAAAQCVACHETPLDSSHSEHGWDTRLGAYYPGTEPSSAPFAAGTSTGNELEKNVDTQMTCSNSNCHEINTGSLDPVTVDDTDASVKYSGGGWIVSSASGYLQNSYTHSNYAGAKAELAFTGQKVQFVSARTRYSGIANVYLDGVLVSTVDLYSYSTEKQFLAYESGQLSSAQHTITVEVAGSTTHTDSHVYLDAFVVYPRLTTTLTKCTACHAPDTYTGTSMDRRNDHAATADTHTATETVGSIATTSTEEPNVACTSRCHQARLDLEHASVIARTSPTALADGAVTCYDCHSDPRKAANKPWNKNCTACHTLHPNFTSSHDWSATSSNGTCGSGIGPTCHNLADIDRIHNNATRTVDADVVKNCNVCHTDDGKPKGLLNGGAAATKCIDCHEAHSTWDHTASSASDGCLACHSTTGRDVKTFHGGSTGCATCHSNAKYPGITSEARHECADCHNTTVMSKDYTPSSSHYAGTEATHTLTPAASTITISGVAYGPYACTACHSTELGPEHAKSTSSSSATGCAACHPTLAKAIKPVNKTTCVQGGCHGTTQPQHGTVTADHAALASNVSCFGSSCHSGNLATIHVNASKVVDGVTRTSCMVCHASGVPATKDCTVCHGAKVAWQHGDKVAQHSATPTGTVRITFRYVPDGHTTETVVPEDFTDVDCSSCHASDDIRAVHNAVAPTNCSKCHPGVVPNTFSTWDKSCSKSGCHSATDVGRVQHQDIDAKHNMVPVAKDCYYGSRCHQAGSMPAVHSNATTTVAGVTYTGCQVCHRNSTATVVVPEYEGWQNDCLGCHPDRNAEHGYKVPNHTARITTGTVVIKGNSFSDVQCGDCHEMELGPEHLDKFGFPCENCHPAPRDTLIALGGWNGSCSQGGCHTLTGGYTPQHATIDASHTPLPNTLCMQSGCHAGGGIAPGGNNLATIHKDATATVDGQVVSSCMVCHNNNEYRPNDTSTPVFQCDQFGVPNTKDCATCHPQGKDTMHAYDFSVHLSSPTSQTIAINGVDYGKRECSSCHFYDLASEHARNTSGFKAAACTLCHTQPYQSLDPTPGPAVGGWTKGCVQAGCHKSGTADEMHASIDATHAPRADNSSCFAGAICHTNSGADLAQIHSTASTVVAGETKYSCAVCHGKFTVESGPASADCLACHAEKTTSHVNTDTMHPSASASSCGSDPRSCHYLYLAREHLRRKDANGVAYTCTTCHNTAASAQVKAAIANHDARCEACHTLSTTHGATTPLSNQSCGDCHGASSAGISAVTTSGANAYNLTAGDHITGYTSSAHSTVATGSQQIQCTTCHDHNAGQMKDLVYRYTTGTPDWSKPSTTHQSMCYLCHATGPVPAEAGKPNTYNGRDVSAEFMRTSKHTLSTGGSTYVEQSYNVFTQTSLAEFTANPLLSQLQVASTSGGEVKLGVDPSGAVNPSAQSNMLFGQSGGTNAFDQYVPADDAWNGSNSAVYVPSVIPTVTVTGSSSFKIPNNSRIFVVNRNATFQYTPPADPTAESWITTANLAPATTIGAGGDTAVNTTGTATTGQCVYFSGASTATRIYWRRYQGTFSSGYGTISYSLGQGSALAFSPKNTRLFFINKSGMSGDGRLYYITSPGQPASVAYPTQTQGIQVTTTTATWNRMTVANVGGTDYLFIMGTNSSGQVTLQVVTNLNGTPTLLSIGLKTPAGWSSVGDGLDLVYNDADGYLYATRGGGTGGFARIQVPTNPGTASSWTGVSWTTLNTGRNWAAGSSLATGAADPLTVTPFHYYGAGTMQASDISGSGYDHWGYVVYDSNVPSGAALSVRVQGVNGSTVTTLVAAATSSPINLLSYDTATYPTLRLTATLSTSRPSDASATPQLDDWTVTAYKGVWLPASGSKVQCESCHNTHKVAKGSGAWDVARVSDPSNTKNTWTGTVTDFCLKCHTGSYSTPQSYTSVITSLTMIPYDLSIRPVTSPFFPGWSKTIANVDFAGSGHFTTSNASKALCQNCHDPHGSDNPELAAWTPTSGVTAANARQNTGSAAHEEKLCYQCHNNSLGTITGGRYASLVLTAGQVPYSHNVTSTDGLHSDEETQGVFGKASTRHVECVDCHDPHASRPGTHTVNSSIAGPALRGAFGVQPSTANTWTAPSTYTPIRMDGQAGSYEAYLCFKCHAGPGLLGGTITRSNGTTYTATDLGLEFNPKNASGHNVAGDVFTKNVTSSTATWNKPSTLTLASGWTVDSQMTCTDCHSGGSTTQAKGPHGASVPYMLKSGSTGHWYTVTISNWSSSQNMCNKCHTTNSHGSWYSQDSEHDRECRHCHVTIPHGWYRPRLIVTTKDPAPYRDSGDGNLTGVDLSSITDAPSNESQCQDSCSSWKHPISGNTW